MCLQLSREGLPIKSSKHTMKSEHYVEQAIVQLLSLKLRAGSPVADVKELSRRCLAKALKFLEVEQSVKGLGIHRLGSVLRAWHRQTPYLTHDGMPRPLRVKGRSSLASLVRRYFPAEEFNLVFECLVESKLIRRFGVDQWIPSGRTARISRLSLETLDHLSEGVARYVETVTRNVTAKSDQEVLFERSCKVTNLPSSEFAAFRQYVDQQAIAFLTSMDDWLESRSTRTSRKVGPRHTAGVHTFAFVVENDVGQTKTK